MHVLLFLSLLLLCASNLSFARVDLSEGLHFKCKKMWKSQLTNMQTEVDTVEDNLDGAQFEIDSFSFCVNPDHDNHPFLNDFKYSLQRLKSEPPQKPIMDAGVTRNYRFMVPDGAVQSLRQRVQGFFLWDGRVDYKGILLTAIQGPVGVPFGQLYQPSGLFSGGSWSRQNSLLCANTNEWYKNFIPQHDVRAIPCIYRPKSSIMHPNILAIKKRGSSTLGNALAFDFKWVDVGCHDVNIMQYHALLVSDFGDANRKAEYNVSISNLFVRHTDSSKKDSKDGIPYETYWGWRPKDLVKGTSSVACTPDLQNLNNGNYKIICLWNNCKECSKCGNLAPGSFPQTTSALYDIVPPFAFKEGHKNELLKQNSAYNNCVWNKTGLDMDTGECPPGPFACAKDDSQSRKAFQDLFPESTTTKGQAMFQLDPFASTHCPSWDENFHLESFCNVSNFHQELITYCKEEVNRTGWVKVQEKDDPDPKDPSKLSGSAVDYVDEFRGFRARNRKIHGGMMIAGIFSVYFLATFVARFFKETSTDVGYPGVLGFGYWLVGHLSLILASLYLLVGGVVFIGIQPSNCNVFEEGSLGRSECEEEKGKRAHRILGFAVLLLPLLNASLGAVRPVQMKVTKVFVWIHTVFGYSIQIIAVINVVLSNACIEIKAVTGVVIIVNIVLIVIATVLQMRFDKKEGIRRSIFPVPEVLESTGIILKSQIVMLFFALLIHVVVAVLIFILYFLQQSLVWQKLKMHSNISVCIF